jgi:hypothetical protein
VKIGLLVVVLMLSNSQAKAIEHFSVKINNRNGNVKSYIIRTLRCTYNESVSANILIGTPRFNYHLRIY